MLRRTKSKFTIFLFFLIIAFSFYKAVAFFSDDRELDFREKEKWVVLDDNGISCVIRTKKAKIGEVLDELAIRLDAEDLIIPGKDEKIMSGMKIYIQRAVKINILADGKKIEKTVLAKDVKGVLRESGIALGRLDKTKPELAEPASEGLEILVTRINVEEVTVKEDIDFRVESKEDKKLGWREKKIEIEGKKGTKEVKYRITYKDNKEISRVKLDSSILEEPVTQVEVQGTYMKLGKAAKGVGTWYAYKGGMFAASTTIPKGEFVKVTSQASGKSVVVQINDYGPQGKGRIIDLDKVAFQKLAPLGAGVIGVRVEHILN